MTTIDSLLAAAPSELRFETELLIADALNWNRAKVLAFGEERVSPDALSQLKTKLSRLESGEPFAYITGEREFFGLGLRVTPEVLIPRPDTELLVELAIDNAPKNARVADLGTGSGAIAISLKHARPDLQLTATDASDSALSIARENAINHNCSITFVQSNWYESLNEQFDVIVSNPPYIRPDDPHLPSLAYEPQQALVATDSGIADLKKIIMGAPALLASAGQLLLEHGYDQAVSVTELLEQAGFTDISTHLDLAGQPRVTKGSSRKDAS